MSSEPGTGSITRTDSTRATGIAPVWTIDPVHSSVEFAVKHMVVATARGKFNSFEGEIHFDPNNPAASSVVASVDTASVDTGDPTRDNHLRSDDFFNAEKFPKLTFRGTRVEVEDDDKVKLYGDLTIRDITRPVVFDVEYEGMVKDPWGNLRAAFTAETTINRKDFGLRWNGVLETGGAIVADKVKVILNIEATRPA